MKLGSIYDDFIQIIIKWCAMSKQDLPHNTCLLNES
jgi:hypothetical protein